MPIQPDRSDPVWGGRTDGAIHECTRTTFEGIPDPSMTIQRWISEADAVPIPPPDPETMAYEILAALQLEAPSMGIFPQPLEEDPDQVGYVGWNQWMWVEAPGPRTWGPISDSASERGYTVTLTATVDHITWDMGNGDVVSCEQGTPWESHLTNNQPSPDCGYTYETMGRYTITATAHWQVEWSGIGQTGTIEMPLSRTATVEIAELQVIGR